MRDESASRPPPTTGELRLAPGIDVATMPRRLGVTEHVVDAQPFAVLIYSRTERELLEPPAKGVSGRRIQRGSVAFFPAGLATRWLYAAPIFDHDRSLHALHLRFSGDFATALGCDPLATHRAPLLDLNTAGLARFMERALSAFETVGPLRTTALQSAALAAAQRFLDRPGETRASAPLSSLRLRALERYVDETEPHQISLTGMADAVGLSPSHFLRLFKRTSGSTPVAWALRRLAARPQ